MYKGRTDILAAKSFFGRTVSLCLAAVLISGCAYLNRVNPDLNLPENPNELTTTGVGAATGSVIGAGLGTIIGAGTGDAGAGLVIGAVAGAGIGALIGRQFEQQEALLSQQQEVLTRQRETLSTHERELEELKRDSDVVPRGSSLRNTQKKAETYSANRRAKPYVARKQDVIEKEDLIEKPEARARMQAEKTVPTIFQPSVTARTEPIKSDLPPAASLPSDAGDKVNNEASAKVENDAVELTDPDVDCTKAQEEAQRGRNSASQADQLFYFRRALRLCPNQADYHAEVGRVYREIGRTDDAEIELRKALDIDPRNNLAQEELTLMQGE